MAATKCKFCGIILENEIILERHYRSVHVKTENLSNDIVEG